MAPRGYRAVKGSAGTRSKAPEGPELPAIREAVGRAKPRSSPGSRTSCAAGARTGRPREQKQERRIFWKPIVARRDGKPGDFFPRMCPAFSSTAIGFRAGSIRPAGATSLPDGRDHTGPAEGHGRFFFRGTRMLPRLSPTTGRSAGPSSRGWWTAGCTAEEQPT